MKQNPCPVVGEVAKPTGIGFDELYGAVESFGAGVADSVLAEVQQSFLVAAQHLDDFLHGLQAAPHRVVGPGFEETFCCTFVAVAPELAEVLLDTPSPTGFQVELVQGTKRDRFSASAIWVLSQPSPFAARQWRSTCLRQLTVLQTSNGIHCLAEVLGDVELVMHDVRLRHALLDCTHVRRPHIHGHRLDRCTLRWGKRLQQTHGRHQLPLRHQVQYARAVNVSQDTGVGMASLRALLINAKVRNFFLGTSQHAALHSADHDGIDRTPGQTGERTNGLGGGTGLEQLDNKRGHQCCDPAVALRPWNCQFFDRCVTEFELGNPSLDDGLELAGIEVAPLALGPAIDMRPLGGVGGVSPNLTLLQNHFDNHTLICQGEVYLLHRPRGLQSKKLFIQHGVFHVVLDNFEKLDCLAVSEKSQ